VEVEVEVHPAASAELPGVVVMKDLLEFLFW